MASVYSASILRIYTKKKKTLKMAGFVVRLDRDIFEFVERFPNIKRIPDFGIHVQRIQRAKDNFVAAAQAKDVVKLKESFDKFLAIIIDIFTGWEVAMDAAADLTNKARCELAAKTQQLYQAAHQKEEIDVQSAEITRLVRQTAALEAELKLASVNSQND